MTLLQFLSYLAVLTVVIITNGGSPSIPNLLPIVRPPVCRTSRAFNLGDFCAALIVPLGAVTLPANFFLKPLGSQSIVGLLRQSVSVFKHH